MTDTIKKSDAVPNPREKTMSSNETTTDAGTTPITTEEWLAIRKEAGLKIDPETYGVHPDLPEEYRQIGREYFARSPGSDIWVSFDDLPDAIREALWEKKKRELAFPAGLPIELLRGMTRR